MCAEIPAEVVDQVGPVIGEQVNYALRRVVVEEQLEVPLRLRSSRCAARKEIRLIRDERCFNVTGVGNERFPKFGAIIHCEVGPFPGEG